MWGTRVDVLSDGHVRRVTVLRDGAAVSYAEVVEQWRASRPFRTFFAALLAEPPYQAYFWETPPVSCATAAQAFEFVLVDSARLAAMAPEPGAFADRFAPGQAVTTFANLGGDALLVAPAPQAPPGAYAHLAALARQAPALQQHALWEAVGDAVAGRLAAKPLWLSTSGLGVAWLHVRLDERPKYYTYAPYRTAAEGSPIPQPRRETHDGGKTLRDPPPPHGRGDRDLCRAGAPGTGQGGAR